MGIYLGLSAIDFPFCYLAVRWFGTERIAKVEHAIMDYFWTTLEKVAPGLMARRETKEALDAAEEATRDADAAVAEKAKHENASKDTHIGSMSHGHLLTRTVRYLDPIALRLRSSQVPHLHPSAAHGCHHAESRQDIAEMGLSDWKAEAEIDGSTGLV